MVTGERYQDPLPRTPKKEACVAGGVPSTMTVLELDAVSNRVVPVSRTT